MRQLLMALLLSLPALGIAQEAKERKLQYEDVEKLYAQGECDGLSFPHEYRREWALLMVEDVLVAIFSGESITRKLWGEDFDVFRMGRTPDQTLTTLYDYMSRKDVRMQAYKDYKALAKVTKAPDGELDNKLIPYCEIYRMLNGQDYAFKPELQSFLQTLNRKIRNKNFENLQNLLEQSE